MGDWLEETPNLGRPWCPGCEPERDPTAEILITEYCGHHRAIEGTADHLLDRQEISLGCSETDGVTQAGMARLLAEGG